MRFIGSSFRLRRILGVDFARSCDNDSFHWKLSFAREGFSVNNFKTLSFLGIPGYVFMDSEDEGKGGTLES